MALSEADAVGKGLRTVKLSPWGRVKTNDGRSYLMDGKSAGAIIQEFSAHGVSVPIDIEHDTGDGGRNGAVGWIEQIFQENGRGLFGLVKWTDSGRDLILAEKFRYLSPAFKVDVANDRRAVILHSAALTTKPAIPKMERLAAAELGESEGLIQEMSQLLGVNCEGDPIMALSEIRNAIKERLATQTEPPSEEPQDTELVAMREENRKLKHRVELEKFLFPYAQRGVIHRLNSIATKDYEDFLWLAEHRPEMCKRVLDARQKEMPPEGQTMAPDRGGVKRMEVIACAETEFDNTPGHQKATTKRAFVNLRLREAELMALTEDEAKLVVG